MVRPLEDQIVEAITSYDYPAVTYDFLDARERSFPRMIDPFTVDDPKAYTRPWTVTFWMQLAADTELLEYGCNENEKDRHHLK